MGPLLTLIVVQLFLLKPKGSNAKNVKHVFNAEKAKNAKNAENVWNAKKDSSQCVKRFY